MRLTLRTTFTYESLYRTFFHLEDRNQETESFDIMQPKYQTMLILDINIY